jgi:hypothetical protein
MMKKKAKKYGKLPFISMKIELQYDRKIKKTILPVKD